MAKKSGLRIDTVLKLKRMFIGRIDSFVAAAINYEYTFKWCLERMTVQVYQSKDYVRLPEWAKREITGYYHAKLDMIHRYLTAFAYKYEGRLYSLRKEINYAKVDWPCWTVLQETHHLLKGRFTPDLCEEHGSYWPSGEPYSAEPPAVARVVQ